jgi:hypothetical protein
MKEININLYRYRNDSYVELFKLIGGNTKTKYIARRTYSGGDNGEWYFVADPLGYCELDHSCPSDYVFVVCDHNGNELFRDSNGEVSNPFPTLERKAELEWYEIMKKYPCKEEGLNHWLLSHLTKVISETKLKDEPCHESNWLHWYDKISRKVIHRFTHLGENYCIYEVLKKHRYCDCEWVDYYSGYELMDEYTGYIKWYGARFDESNTGPNYSRSLAIQYVINAMKKIYQKEQSLSYVKQAEYGDFELKMDYYQAAEFLLKGNYDRSFVHEVADKEKDNRTFYDCYKKMNEDFPNIRMHYSF